MSSDKLKKLYVLGVIGVYRIYSRGYNCKGIIYDLKIINYIQTMWFMC